MNAPNHEQFKIRISIDFVRFGSIERLVIRPGTRFFPARSADFAKYDKQAIFGLVELFFANMDALNYSASDSFGWLFYFFSLFAYAAWHNHQKYIEPTRCTIKKKMSLQTAATNTEKSENFAIFFRVSTLNNSLFTNIHTKKSNIINDIKAGWRWRTKLEKSTSTKRNRGTRAKWTNRVRISHPHTQTHTHTDENNKFELFRIIICNVCSFIHIWFRHLRFGNWMCVCHRHRSWYLHVLLFLFAFAARNIYGWVNDTLFLCAAGTSFDIMRNRMKIRLFQ